MFQNLHDFSCIWNDDTGWDCSREGIGPKGALIQGKDGSFYGTLTGGGPSNCGAVFKMTPDGEVTMLAFFSGTNGCYPYGGLLQATDGNFYGTTRGTYGDTIFRLTPSGSLTGIGGFSPGTSPVGDLTEGPDGWLYGVTWHGGCRSGDDGTIFRISTNGWLQNLHCFSGGDGYNPSGGLLLAKDGNFYGVTAGGGIGYGTVYRLSTSGVLTTLAWFPGDAVNPVGKLVEAVDGNLYGVAGGLEGTVFRLARDGGLTTVAWFDGANGETPVGLIQARDGNFYGECYTGGIPGDWYGTVFKMTPGGVISRVVSFTGYGGDRPGRYPWAGVVEGNDGNLYGTTWQGGTPQAGNVFRIIMPGPLLSSARIDDSLILSWRTNYTGYVLQSSTDLSRNEWIDCINTTSIVSGQYVVTNSLSDSSRFFRLSKISQP